MLQNFLKQKQTQLEKQVDFNLKNQRFQQKTIEKYIKKLPLIGFVLLSEEELPIAESDPERHLSITNAKAGKIKSFLKYKEKKDFPPVEDLKQLKRQIEVVKSNWHLKVMLQMFVLHFNKS